MASIQKSTEKGYRIYWRLYFPNGTSKIKYKASSSKSVLQEILPDVMKIETLSRRGDLTAQDLFRARNLRIITTEEVHAFSPTVENLEAHYMSELRADYETRSKAESSSQHSHMANLYKGNVLEKYFEKIPIHQITPDTIDTFRAERKEIVNNTTVNQDLKALRKYLDSAINKGWIRENPARKVKLLREPRDRIPRCLYQGEIDKLFKGFAPFKHWLHGDFEFIVRCLIYTGLRRGELCRLKPENVKLHLRQIHILGKGQKARAIGIHKSLIPDLKERIKRGHIIHPGLQPSSISRAFKVVCRKLGLPQALTLHSLRHSYISYLLEKGVPPKRVRELAGHFSLAITDRYTHAIPKKKIDEDLLDFDSKV